MRQLAPFTLFTVLIIFFAIGLTKNPRLIPSPLIGKPLPLHQLVELQTPSNVIHTNNLKGENFVLNVWASWCGACLEEHSTLMNLADSQDVLIVGLNYKDNRSQAKHWLGENGNPYSQIWFDPAGEFGMELGVYGVPETFFVNQDGIIAYKHVGPLNRTVIASALALLDTSENAPL